MSETQTTPSAATEKKAPKMAQVLGEDGSVTFRFDGAGEQRYALDQFPEDVRTKFAIFGMRTKLRNFTAQEAGEKGEITPAEMATKLAAGAKLLLAGAWKVAREAGEKGGVTTIMLEAAVIYRRMKTEARGETYSESLEDVAKALEALTDEQVEALKSTTLFKLAMAEVQEKRAAARKAKLLEQAAKEAAATA